MKYLKILFFIILSIPVLAGAQTSNSDYTQYETEDVSVYRQHFSFEYPVIATTPKVVETPPYQSLENTYFKGGNKVYIDANPKLQELVRTHKETSNQPTTSQGYRIQIFAGSKEGAQSSRSRFMGTHPGVASYLKHIAPTYRVRVGNFTSRSEAQLMLDKLRASFPKAWVVKDVVSN